MTPEDKQRARDLLAATSQGSWRCENLNWVGSALFAVYAEEKYGARDKTVLENVGPDNNAYYNIEFLTAAHNEFPRMLAHIEALEANLAAAKDGKPASAAPALSAKELSALKETLTEATPGPWSWKAEPQLGAGIHAVYTGAEKGGLVLGPMDTGPNAANNLAFITQARDLMPKALAHIEALDSELASIVTPPEPKSAPKTAPKTGTAPKF